MAPDRVSPLTHPIETLSTSMRIIDAPVSRVRSGEQHFKMADFVGVRARQRVVNEFLTAESSI